MMSNRQKHKTDFGLYVIITQPAIPHAKIAEACVTLGVRMLQLREKDIPDRKLLQIAREIKSVIRGSDTKLVINDRPDIAKLCDADYLHLGQDDSDIDDARKIVGNMPIGLSTHSLSQAHEALSKNPAYIGFGPIYSTTTKALPDPPVGIEQLRKVISFATVPVVALGGLFPENLDTVLKAGARTVALVRHLMQTENFFNRAKALIQQIESYVDTTHKG